MIDQGDRPVWRKQASRLGRLKIYEALAQPPMASGWLLNIDCYTSVTNLDLCCFFFCSATLMWQYCSSGLGNFPQVIALCDTLLLILAHGISLSAMHGCIVGEHGHVLTAWNLGMGPYQIWILYVFAVNFLKSEQSTDLPGCSALMTGRHITWRWYLLKLTARLQVWLHLICSHTWVFF